MTDPVYMRKMPVMAWRLLWWLIAKADERGEVHGTWRTEAAIELGADRPWLTNCGRLLAKEGLIDAPKNTHYAKILVLEYPETTDA